LRLESRLFAPKRTGRAFRRPLALAVFRFFADPKILGRSSLAMAGLYWIVCVSASLATGHASPVRFSQPSSSEAMFRYLSWQAGHGLAGTQSSTAIERALDAHSGDARGVLPFAVLLLPVAHRGVSPPRYPHMPLSDRTASIGSTGFSSRDRPGA